MEEGVLVDVSTMAAEAGFTIPVAVTDTVWDIFIEWTDEDTSHQTHQDIQGRLWDVLWMLRCAISKNRDENCILYEFYGVPRDRKSKKALCTQLKAVIDGDDSGKPVITIMLPDED